MNSLEWAAGLFEGEGCIYLRKRANGAKALVLLVQMTDEDIVKNFAEVAGFGSVNYSHPPSRQATQQPMWIWAGYGKKAEEFILRLSPLLGKRRNEKMKAVFEQIWSIN